MPRLLLFAPCEKLIVDESGNPTLVCLLENINVEVEKDKAVPDDAFSPMEWDVVTLWRPEPGDAGKQFKQRFAFEFQDGKVAMQSTIEFKMGEGSHRIKVHIRGFPVGKPGEYLAKVWLDSPGESPSDEPLAVLPLRVIHKAPA